MPAIFEWIKWALCVIWDMRKLDAREWGMIWSITRVMCHFTFKHNDWIKHDDEFYFDNGLACEYPHRERMYCIACKKSIYEDKMVPKYVIP